MSADFTGSSVASESGLRVDLSATGALRRFDCGAIAIALFVGNDVEAAPTNLYLRRRTEAAGPMEHVPLLGPRSHTRFRFDPSTGRLAGAGSWHGVDYTIALVLAQRATAWFWHVHLKNTLPARQQLDLTYAQDVAIAPYGAVRLNEYYVSQYLDHTPLSHPTQGTVVATRQNLAADGRHPWCVIGSLRSGTSFATDALQFHGLSSRVGEAPPGLIGDLPGRRLQHEHAMIVIRDAPLEVEPGGEASAGFFGSYVADHPDATSAADLQSVSTVLQLPEAQPLRPSSAGAGSPQGGTLFSAAPLMVAQDLDADALRALFGTSWRHQEVGADGSLLSFFHGSNRHVVLRSKELHTLRPHGHLLRTGRHLTPDETALTSTVWMGGVFHSMLTQGHVNINRLLSTVHGYIGLFRSHGQRVFAEIGGQWRLLDVPSAFEMAPEGCLWVYRHDAGMIQVRSEARSEPHELTLSIAVTSGDPVRFLISHHVSLNGDDGSVAGPAHWRREGPDLVVVPAPASDLGRRFPDGCFRIAPLSGTEFQTVGGDELLFLDRRSRQQPYLCIVTAPATMVGLRIQGQLVGPGGQAPLRVEAGSDLIPRVSIGATSNPLTDRVAEIVPWFAHNALVHYLAPRGLEQYSGGGWGTRDVCQGPVELLLALGSVEAIRDLLLRVMKEQNPDGDWPQWFTFFERERNIRAGDSHGDIVFWPLVVLGQYLVASGDASVLGEAVPFFDPRGTDAGEQLTVWQHVERALSLIEKRVVAGTALAAYGHGDWNDSLQPADPSLREHMCSAWTVTLHFQMLKGLARGLSCIGRQADAARLETLAEAVRRDFQRILIADGVLTGYAVFEPGERDPRFLLHPRDDRTGVRYSSLAMIHAILEDMLTPEQVRDHLKLIDTRLSASDGVRLFDRPMTYHGGLERLFQRAETATYFGREIGLMYTHAHLRYAQAMAHIGEAERFFRALCQAVPIQIASIVPRATLRQANCYYSSSDAAFEDRYQASAQYERVAQGTIALDGGWRVYSSGAGIALGLIVRHFLGLSCEASVLRVDPVMPKDLDGMRVEVTLFGRRFEVVYRVRGAGCGVNDVALNGRTLPLTACPNPHRRGAALLPRTALLQGPAAGQSSLSIDIG